MVIAEGWEGCIKEKVRFEKWVSKHKSIEVVLVVYYLFINLTQKLVFGKRKPSQREIGVNRVV